MEYEYGLMTKADKYLVESIYNILQNGIKDENPRPKYEDGTPAHTYFVTHQMRQYDLSKGEFPICTLRPIAWKSAIKEMFWIFQKESNDLKVLNEMGVSYWNLWDIGDGTNGYRYGHTVHRYDLFRKRVLDDIKNNPYGRYHICNLWQEEEFKDEPNGLKPCAYETIWTVRREYLDLFLNQRSGDLLAASGGGGINETQYAALLMMVAKHTGYKPGKFTHFVANEQVYDLHIDQAKELIHRANERHLVTFEALKNSEIDKNLMPKLVLNPEKNNFYDMTIDDFSMENYKPMKPQLKLPLGI